MKTINITWLSLLIILITTTYSVAQKPNKYEKRWAYRHPIAAIKAKKITAHVISTTKQLSESKQLDAYLSGGTMDAFRHGYWMALLTQKIGAKKAEQLGLAHEKLNKANFYFHVNEDSELPDSMSTVMDLANNTSGIILGSQNKKLNKEELKELVLKKIAKGGFNILARRNGKYIDCSFATIFDRDLKKWNAPKCLVASNFTPF